MILMIEKGRNEMEMARARVVKRNEQRTGGKPDQTIAEEVAQLVNSEADDIDMAMMEGSPDEDE
jgi:hypothetical protein